MKSPCQHHKVRSWTRDQCQLYRWEGAKRTGAICFQGAWGFILCSQLGCHGSFSMYYFVPIVVSLAIIVQYNFDLALMAAIPAWSISDRRDALRFLKAIDGEKFADGVRQTLSDDEIGMAFWLSTGFPPQLRLKDLRAGTRGELSFDLLI